MLKGSLEDFIIHPLISHFRITACIVGHFPDESCRLVSLFLQHVGSALAIVTGESINRGNGLGEEVPVQYIFTMEDPVLLPGSKESSHLYVISKLNNNILQKFLKHI